MPVALVISGKIVPLDRANPDAVFKGRVFIDDSGSIEQVTVGTAAVPTGFATAPVLDVGEAFVLPGLIDLHSHIGYNSLPLWAEQTQQTPFVHHDSWTRAPSYQGSISWPAKALVKAAPEALLAYVQLRALVGGTAAIQGWPAANRDYVQVLRDIDDETAGTTNHNLIYTSALTLEALALGRMAQAEKQGAGFIYHCAEGQTGSLVLREFLNASNAGCLDKTFIGIHCNAVTATDWQRWPKGDAGTLVWSPFSNYWLYGMTTDIAAARKQEVSICVGSDWGPSGSKNVQGEIKVAKLASQKLGLGLTDRELVAMITSNPGDALSRCWKKNVGRLSAGAFGDITVFRPRGTASVWSQIVDSTEREIMLVVQAGVPRYGDAALMTQAGLTKSSAVTVRGKQRHFAIPDPKKPTDAWSWHDISSQLGAVIKDPVTALKHAQSVRRAFAGSMDASDAPLELELDMPTGGLAFAGDISDHAAEIKIPPLPTLVHDAAFFKSIKGRGFHGGLLDGLKTFYS
jgi:cytosine/adenosine deaminase-related metal-dependent hydrolase